MTPELIEGSYTADQMEAYKKGLADGRHLEARTPKHKKKTSIPALKPHTIPRYIAAIPKAVASGEITAAQGNGLLYAAQMLISLLRASQPPTPTPQRRAGFEAPKKAKK